MKIGAVGLGNRIAHVFHELSQINQEAKLVAYVDPLPIGKDYSEKHNFFHHFSSRRGRLSSSEQQLQRDSPCLQFCHPQKHWITRRPLS